MYFHAKRNGIVLVIRVRSDEATPASAQEAEVDRAEAIGREILQEANGIFAEMQQAEMQQQQQAEVQQQADALAQREREQREPREQTSGQATGQNQELADFMAGNRARNRGFAQQEPSAQPGGQSGSEPGQPGAQPGRSLHCCINGSFYSCPDTGAVDQCIGEFTRCIQGCGLECMEECLQSHPPNPSSCTRQAGRDSEC